MQRSYSLYYNIQATSIRRHCEKKILFNIELTDLREKEYPNYKVFFEIFHGIQKDISKLQML